MVTPIDTKRGIDLSKLGERHEVQSTAIGVGPTSQMGELDGVIGSTRQMGELDGVIDPTRQMGELDGVIGPSHQMGELDGVIGPTRPFGELDCSSDSEIHFCQFFSLRELLSRVC